MKTWVRKSLNVGVLGAGIVLVSGGVAQASTNIGTDNGNTHENVFQAPVDNSGNAIAIFGEANASSTGGATATNRSAANGGDRNIGRNNGNSTSNVVQAPSSTCGNAVAVFGEADAECVGGARATNGGTASGTGLLYPAGGRGGNFNYGTGNGNSTSNVTQRPTDNSGNATAVYGEANAASVGGAWATNSSGNGGGDRNIGRNNGNSTSNVVQAPSSTCGNALAIFGEADAECVGGAAASNGGAVRGTGSGGNHGGGYGGRGDNDGGGRGDKDGYGGGRGDKDGYGGGRGDKDGHGGGRGDKDGHGGGRGDHKGGYGGGSGSSWGGHKGGSWSWGGHKGDDCKGGGHHGGGHHGGGHHGGGNNNGGHHGGGHHGGGHHGGGHQGGGNNNGGHHGGGHHGGGNKVDKGWFSGHSVGFLNNNQINTTVQAPVNISGNALSILGEAYAEGNGGATAINNTTQTQRA